MKNRFLLLTGIMVVVLALLVTGCGTDRTTATTQAVTEASKTETTKAEATKVEKLVIGLDDTYPPMEFRDDNNNLVGFDVDFITAVAEKMGAEIEFQPVAWDGIFGGLEAGRYDCIVSSVSMTAERMEKFEFTKPYLANGQVIVVKPGDTSITKPEDLAGKKVGVQTETTADQACKKYLEKMQFELTRYDEIIQTFEAMATGRLDCIVVDYAVALEYVTKQPEKYAITTTQLTNEPIAVCFKKGNTELRDMVQSAIDELRKEGKLSELSNKWFKDDYTSNIDEKLY